jgi:hypothetical protein
LNRNSKSIKIHVWAGAELEQSETGGQKTSFDLAIGDILSSRSTLYPDRPHIQVEYRGNRFMRKYQVTPIEMVDWLLDGDIHFILTHPHQGVGLNRNYPAWNTTDLRNSLQLLKFHPGFPYSKELNCPVFLQDKYRYIEVLHEFSLPTKQIFLTGNGEYDSAEIQRYVLVI